MTAAKTHDAEARQASEASRTRRRFAGIALILADVAFFAHAYGS
jgi:hypothetical protein